MSTFPGAGGRCQHEDLRVRDDGLLPAHWPSRTDNPCALSPRRHSVRDHHSLDLGWHDLVVAGGGRRRSVSCGHSDLNRISLNGSGEAFQQHLHRCECNSSLLLGETELTIARNGRIQPLEGRTK